MTASFPGAADPAGLSGALLQNLQVEAVILEQFG